jgi:DNA primase
MRVNHLENQEVTSMGKIDLGTTKYVIRANIETNGIVEKPDVVGAVFGQTEGLLGDDLDLRELQKTGRIGRIEVNIESKGGRSKGTINVPSSLDKVETAILAAALETIDRVGPCEAKITISTIEDVRVSKRKRVIERAKEILNTMVEEITPDSLEITEEVKEAFRLQEIVSYGKDKLPAGPNVKDSDAVIIVEGRADVINLLKHGIKNAIAVEGTSIPQTIIDLSKERTTTVFTDGDRGGELILRELLQVAEIDFVARAPDGKEVEELTKKEIFKALRNKVPAEQVKGSLAIDIEKKKKTPKAVPKPPKNEKTEKFKKLFVDLTGTLKAYLVDPDINVIKEVAVRDLAVALKNSKEKISAVIFDGVITQRLVEISSERGVEYLVGAKVGNITKKPAGLKIFTAAELGVS